MVINVDGRNKNKQNKQRFELKVVGEREKVLDSFVITITRAYKNCYQNLLIIYNVYKIKNRTNIICFYFVYKFLFNLFLSYINLLFIKNNLKCIYKLYVYIRRVLGSRCHLSNKLSRNKMFGNRHVTLSYVLISLIWNKL